MPLTTRTNGSFPANIVAASWWNDFKDLLTGVMVDQAVNINNSVNVNSLITDYGNTYGIYVADSFGAPQRAMHVHTDGDLHLIPSPVNNKLRITKNSYAYDIAIFDASGTTGVTTLNGSLTLTGGAASVTCTTLTCTTLVATSIASVTTGALVATSITSNTFNDSAGYSHLAITPGTGGLTRIQDATKITFQVPGGTEQGSITSSVFTMNNTTVVNGTLTVNGASFHVGDSSISGQLYFSGGNNGSVRNPSGGALELSAGGSGPINFFTGLFASNIGSLDHTGQLTVSAIVTNSLFDSAGQGHLIITTGGGAITRLEDPTKLSFQVPGGSEQVSITSTTTTVNTDMNVNGTFTVAGDSKLTGQLYFTGGNNGSVRNPSGGALELSAGGSAPINFFTGLFGASIGNLDSTGQLTVTSLKSNTLLDSTGQGHIVITTGGGAITRIEDPLKISLQVPGGSERFYVNSTDVHSNVTFTAPVVRFGTGGLAKVANGTFSATSGNSITVSNTLGNAGASIAYIGSNNGVVLWLSAESSSSLTFSWGGSTAPQNVSWFGWVQG